MRKSPSWSYVTWYHEYSGNWATWEPGELVSLGDVGRFDKDRQFSHFQNLTDCNISFTPSPERSVGPHHQSLGTGEAVHVVAKAAGQSASGFDVLGRADAGLRITAEKKYACVLQARKVTESYISNIKEVIDQIAELIRSKEWDLDLIVVARRLRARTGFAAISQGAGQSMELKATGDARLTNALEIGKAKLLLASDRSATGFLFYEFSRHATPAFSKPIRVKRDLWGRLLPWRREGPWIIDPAGGRHSVDKLPVDLSYLPPEARRYDPRHSPMTFSELSRIPSEDLFEVVTTLADVDVPQPAEHFSAELRSAEAEHLGMQGSKVRVGVPTVSTGTPDTTAPRSLVSQATTKSRPTLVAIVYQDEMTATAAADEARRLAQDLIIQPDAIAVIIRDKEGNYHVQTSHHAVGAGAVWGMFWGFLFGVLFFIPVFGMAIGAGMGALVGKVAKASIDKQFQGQVRDMIKPGSSAVFLMLEKVTPDKAVEALSQYGGMVLKTSLSNQDEQELQEVLHGGSAAST